MEFLKKDLAAHPTDGLGKYRVVLAAGVGVAWERETSWNYLHGVQMKNVREHARELAQA